MRSDDLELLDLARQARERSYAPISRYRVGAALRTPDGRVIQGCNVENIVLHETACAEKVALLKAVSEGVTAFDVVAICTDDDPPATPCGSCRQMLNTWGVKRVVVTNLEGDVRQYATSDLIPHAFSLLPEPRRE